MKRITEKRLLRVGFKQELKLVGIAPDFEIKTCYKKNDFVIGFYGNQHTFLQEAGYYIWGCDFQNKPLIYMDDIITILQILNTDHK